MIRNIILGTYFWVTMFITLVIYPVYYFIRLFSFKKASIFLMHGARIWSKHLLSVAGIRLHIKGKENIPESDRVCFVSNHQSYLDIPVLVSVIRKQLGFIAKKELNKVPILNLWMPALGCVLIDRKKPSSSLQKAKRRIGKINQGRPLFIFPEGTRSKGNKPGRFRTGSIGFLIQHNILILPVTINGTYKLLEEKNTLKKGTVDIYFHPPVPTDEIDPEQNKKLAKKLEEIVFKPLKEDRG